MSKRSLSPATLPSSKRLHTTRIAKSPSVQPLRFDDCLYDELILYIFSYLSWVDLCVSQPTNHNWARLAADNELWRNLYLRTYGRTRLRGSKGFISRADGREVKPLPGRAKTDQLKDWKWMFRISSNWKKGRCLVELFTPSLPLHPPYLNYDDYMFEQQSHIVLAGSLTITATSSSSQNPTIIITFPPNRQQALTFESSQQGVAAITALALDQSPPTSGHMSLAGFLSTGEFSVFEFNHNAPLDLLHKFSYKPPGPCSRASPIIKAVYHHPLLVTLSRSFSLSLYDLSSGVIRLTQTLSSFTSYPPASLVLSTPSPTTYKLVLAYSVPVYPGHWSVGATELMISKSLTLSMDSRSLLTPPTFFEEFKHVSPSSMGVITTRTVRAVDVPLAWVDEIKLRAIREQWSRKVSRVADAQSDGKWLVLAPGNEIQEYGCSSPASASSSSPPSNTSSSNSVSSSLHSPTGLQLYRLVLPAQSNSVSASPPKLNFIRTLYGQTSPVTALALADGRCVSLGLNGSIWVWDLEGGTGAEVAPANHSITTKDFNLRSTKNTVSFDERRIITAYAGKIIVRRFDI
ncbi:hypothetical protein BYT27DRAFT_7339095 [Phlegmacium glaucopus]|nr:hypothetical protein BYT27DRAFT_7339095 [Phlegmacium glaucopus]